MNRSFAAASVFAVLISLISTAQAANLEIARGEVLLSQGSGYRAVRNSMELQVGDTVVSKPGGAARITFADGCSLHLGMGMVFTVEAKSPCGPGAAGMVSQADSIYIPEPDETLSSADSWNAGTETFGATEDTQTNIWPYVLGAAAAGGIAAAAATLAGGGGSSPVSP